MIVHESRVEVVHHSLHYANAGTSTAWVASIYVVVTVGSLVASTHNVIRWFGIVNLVGVVATLAIAYWAFTSIWCLYAAVVNVILYWQFSNRKINIQRPNQDMSRGAEPSFS